MMLNKGVCYVVRRNMRKIHGACDKQDQFDFLMSKEPRGNEWVYAPTDTVTAGWGLTLSAFDMAKIGWMLLNGGFMKSVRFCQKNGSQK